MLCYPLWWFPRKNDVRFVFTTSFVREYLMFYLHYFYTPVFRRDVLWYTNVRLSVRPSVRPFHMSRSNLSCVSWKLLKFYQLFTGEERRMPFIFDDFHFCRSGVIGLDLTENRIVTLCRMITWVVFLRMFWNFISSLPVKRGGSLSFLVGTIRNVLFMEIGLVDVGSGGIS